eukprot:EG_transcript_26534
MEEVAISITQAFCCRACQVAGPQYKAAGLLAFVREAEEVHFLLIRHGAGRGQRKTRNPLIVDLGGKREPSDASCPARTAAREFLEELGGEAAPSPGAVDALAEQLRTRCAEGAPEQPLYSRSCKYALFLVPLSGRLPLASDLLFWLPALEFMEALSPRSWHWLFLM